MQLLSDVPPFSFPLHSPVHLLSPLAFPFMAFFRIFMAFSAHLVVYSSRYSVHLDFPSYHHLTYGANYSRRCSEMFNVSTSSCDSECVITII